MPTKAPKKKPAARPKAATRKPAARTVKKVERSSDVQAFYAAVGRRKTAVARVRLMPGKGAITVNGKTMQQYFPDVVWQTSVTSPLVLVGQRKSLDVSVLTDGGGVNSQAEATRHAIARALQIMDSELRSTLKKAGFLKRDPREKERKKYGLKGARRAPQFSKR
ncbi:MAG: 30S ribosomal protein S9 [bacterium]|nr:30S ribosomal protein S9 [bacterium]